MKSRHVYLHVYPQEQIKFRLRGDLIYVFDIPRTAVRPVIREIYDVTGRDFPPVSDLNIFSVDRADSEHIIFAGVNKTSVYDVMAFDPPLLNNRPEVEQYNRLLVPECPQFLLERSGSGSPLRIGE